MSHGRRSVDELLILLEAEFVIACAELDARLEQLRELLS